MKRILYNLISINLLILFMILASSVSGTNPVDGKATSETKALFANLKEIQKSKILVGQHDATMYGHTWSGDDNRSDMKDVCG
ncbi:MAG: beta-mannosidase, partial [Paludibacter sp.]